MRQFIIFASVLCSLLLAGCLVVPIPHRRLSECGVKGRIFDAGTQSPVTAAKVEDTVDPTKFTFSGLDGSFDLKPVYAMHGGYIVAGVSGSVFPEYNAPAFTRTITIIAPGYRNLTIPLSKTEDHTAYIDAETISLKR